MKRGRISSRLLAAGLTEKQAMAVQDWFGHRLADAINSEEFWREKE